MATAHPPFLWRYMPLMGLLRLLQVRALHAARSDQFEDLLEGRFGFDVMARHIGMSLQISADLSACGETRDAELPKFGGTCQMAIPSQAPSTKVPEKV
jgi:hypothetical protein